MVNQSESAYRPSALRSLRGVEFALVKELVVSACGAAWGCCRRRGRGVLALAPQWRRPKAVRLFFWRRQKHRRASPAASSFFADPFGLNQQQTAGARAAPSRTAWPFAWRSCDGKYFSGHLARQCAERRCRCARRFVRKPDNSVLTAAQSTARPRQRRSAIRRAKTPRLPQGAARGCTCNGRDPAGLPVDLTLDGSLRPGDVVATASGLSLTLVKVGNGPSRENSPRSLLSRPHARSRARLGEIKVAL